MNTGVTSATRAMRASPAAADIAAMIIDSRTMPFIVVQDELVVLANPALSAMFRAPGSMVGRRFADLFVASGDRPAAPPPATPGAMPLTWSGRAARVDGTTFEIELHVASESLHGDAALCMFAENVTPRLLSEQQLSSLAYSDALTGLANRALLLDRLRDAIALADSNATSLAVLMADLDKLKHVNDKWGHQTGDVLLQLMAQRFREIIRDTDTLARLGGDEFCVLVPRIRARGDAEAIASRFVQVAREAVGIGGHEIRVSASVGIAIYPDHGRSADALVAAADEALYRAKEGGRNRFAWATGDSHRPAVSLPLIVWTVAHDLGIPELDQQHRQLADRINILAAALQQGDRHAEIGRLLEEAIAATRSHFAAEERLMDSIAFEDAPAHRQIHAQLLDDLCSFLVGNDHRSVSMTIRFLQEWLLRHIESSDRSLARALQEQRPSVLSWPVPAQPADW